MAEDLYRVELTASFLERLDAIEAFLTEADEAFAFDALRLSAPVLKPDVSVKVVAILWGIGFLLGGLIRIVVAIADPAEGLSRPECVAA